MPHVMIDYAPVVEDHVNMADFCEVLRKAAIETGIFPLPGIRVRAVRANHVAIADGNSKHGYIDVSVRLRGGRPAEARRAAIEDMFLAAKDFLKPALEHHSIALSFEMRDIDPDLSPKYGTIREHLDETGRHD